MFTPKFLIALCLSLPKTAMLDLVVGAEGAVDL